MSLSAVAGPNAGPGPNALPSDKRACSSENIPMECGMDVDQSESSRQVALASGRWQAPQNYGLSSFVCAKSEDSQFLEPHPALSMLLAANFNARVHDWIWKVDATNQRNVLLCEWVNNLNPLIFNRISRLKCVQL